MKKPRPYLTKWAPLNVIDFRGMECWLEQLAAQGLIYQEQSRWNLLLGGPYNPHFFLAKFHREAPLPNRRYRMVPTPKMATAPSSEQRQLYEAAGWHYVDLIEMIYVSYFLFMTDDPDALEPYTDPESFRLAFRYPIWSFVFLAVFVLILGFLRNAQAAANLWTTQESHFFGGNGFGLAAFLLILAISLIGPVNTILDLAAVFLLRRQTRQRQTAQPALPHWLFPTQKLFCALSAAMVLLDAVWIGLLLLRLPRTVPLEDWRPDFDLLTLAEMEGDGTWIPSQSWEAMGVSIQYNVAEVYPHPAPLKARYQINQAGSGPHGSASFDLVYFVADTAQRNEELFSYLKEEIDNPDGPLDSSLPDTLALQPVSVSGAEEFQVRRMGRDWEILAQAEQRILFLQYSGSQDLTDWFEDVAAMLLPQDPETLEPFPAPPVRETIPLSEWAPPFPLLTLEAMEEAGSWVPREDFYNRTLNRTFHPNSVEIIRDASAGTPLRYSIAQRGTGSSGDSSLSITYYPSGSAQNARVQLESLLRESSAPLQELSVPGAERFLVRALGTAPEDHFVPSWEILAQKGEQVLSLQYDGFLDLSQWYEEIAAMLTPTLSSGGVIHETENPKLDSSLSVRYPRFGTVAGRSGQPERMVSHCSWELGGLPHWSGPRHPLPCGALGQNGHGTHGGTA